MRNEGCCFGNISITEIFTFSEHFKYLTAWYEQLHFIWTKKCLQWRLIYHHVKTTSERFELKTQVLNDLWIGNLSVNGVLSLSFMSQKKMGIKQTRLSFQRGVHWKTELLNNGQRKYGHTCKWDEMSQIWNNLTNTEIQLCCIGSVKTVDHLSCNISSKRRSVSSPEETLRRELKIRRAAEYFWRNFEVFHLVIKHCAQCFILLLNQNDFRRRNKWCKNEQFFIWFPNTGRTGGCCCKMSLRSFPTYKHPSPSSYSPHLLLHKKVPPIITPTAPPSNVVRWIQFISTFWSLYKNQ